MAQTERSTRRRGEDVAPLSAIAARLCEEERRPLVYLARNERRAALLAGILAGLAPKLEALFLPAWDCVPYDRIAPTRQVMGRRIEALRRLAADPDGPWIVMTYPDAVVQRVPPASAWDGVEYHLEVGRGLSVDGLSDYLLRTGYIIDERVDEAGEAAIRGSVIDIFPAAAPNPYRLDHADGRVTGIRQYDAVSQRTLSEAAELLLGPASEVVPPPVDSGDEAPERFAGMEH